MIPFYTTTLQQIPLKQRLSVSSVSPRCWPLQDQLGGPNWYAPLQPHPQQCCSQKRAENDAHQSGHHFQFWCKQEDADEMPAAGLLEDHPAYSEIVHHERFWVLGRKRERKNSDIQEIPTGRQAEDISSARHSQTSDGIITTNKERPECLRNSASCKAGVPCLISCQKSFGIKTTHSPIARARLIISSALKIHSRHVWSRDRMLHRYFPLPINRDSRAILDRLENLQASDKDRQHSDGAPTDDCPRGES